VTLGGVFDVCAAAVGVPERRAFDGHGLALVENSRVPHRRIDGHSHDQEGWSAVTDATGDANLDGSMRVVGLLVGLGALLFLLPLLPLVVVFWLARRFGLL
jgi:hypothetical protein